MVRAVAFVPCEAFGDGFARFRMGSQIGSYRAVLVASHEHGSLDRKIRRAAGPTPKATCNKPEMPPSLYRWEDDGGRVRAWQAQP